MKNNLWSWQQYGLLGGSPGSTLANNSMVNALNFWVFFNYISRLFLLHHCLALSKINSLWNVEFWRGQNSITMWNVEWDRNNLYLDFYEHTIIRNYIRKEASEYTLTPTFVPPISLGGLFVTQSLSVSSSWTCPAGSELITIYGLPHLLKFCIVSWIHAEIQTTLMP